VKNVTLASRLSRSLKVIETDTDRSDTYDLLLMFHSNHGPILYRFRDSEINDDFSRKSRIFPSHPMYFAPLLKGFPLELDIGDSDKN